MKLSANGISALEHSEGLKLIAYLCSAKVWSIGLGTTVYPNGAKVMRGDVITKEQAYEYAAHDLAQFGAQVNRLVQVPLTQNQFDALVLLTYNIGGGGLEKSTTLRKLNKGDYKAAAKAFMMWDKITDEKTNKKVFSQGLHDRRKREMELFLRKDNPNTNEIAVYHEPDPNNTPVRNRDLPLPTAYQQYGIDGVFESEANLSDKQKIAVATTTGVVGASGVVTVISDPQVIIEHAPSAIAAFFKFLQSSDWRVALAMVGLVAVFGLIWWIRGRR